ncbi:unnamed protein product [Ilex paraguariensis]|uniref:Uncharacterized protein n=1 Tax=Ilex paraguariensis TaxID=185542 RepID=A0ABC8RQL2_9AQUA
MILLLSTLLCLDDDKTSELRELDYAHPVVAKFDRLLVEGKHSGFGCFYLSENLNENDDYSFWVQKDDQENTYDMSPALPMALDHPSGAPLNLYNDQHMCLHFGMTGDGDRDKCINPEGFARFLGLLESIPIHSTGSTHESSEHATPDLR